MIFWLIFALDAVALTATGSFLRILPRHERPHRLDVAGAILITMASIAFMLALNLGGKSYPWKPSAQDLSGLKVGQSYDVELNGFGDVNRVLK